ncbi:hypothetical protein D6L41_02000 [Vibrio alginolyticus]|uniref:Uncharacterized protein n=2 Tax=Vibrio harveyi group TaxID=717610 RepID=A0A7Y4B1R0_VIBAL|nr:hypothetical protein [Vibrio alginolyticus]EGR2699106.1 hypothetical protein [Vibrio parahaemolyticus]KAB0317004.1 hypothetical protein F6W79_18405 [Vibrio diabolicus]NOI08957.1 hypothetical protein [Vibrio alginolyticus]
MLLFHVVPFGCTRLKSDFMKQGNGRAWKLEKPIG